MQVQGKKAIEIKVADVAELVDARDLKSLDGNVVWVRLPPPAPGRNQPPIVRSDQVITARTVIGLTVGGLG